MAFSTLLNLFQRMATRIREVSSPLALMVASVPTSVADREWRSNQ
jgi:hypothetical protein